MQHLRKTISAFLFSDQAVTAVEYAMMIGLVVVAVSVGLAALGRNVQKATNSAASAVASHTTAAANTNKTPLKTVAVSSSQLTHSGPGITISKGTIQVGPAPKAGKKTAGVFPAEPIPTQWGSTQVRFAAFAPDDPDEAPPGPDEYKIYASGSEFTNGSVAIDATLFKGGGYAVLFRLSADPVKEKFNGYAFQYDTGYGKGAFLLRKWVNGIEVWKPLAVKSPPADYQWYDVQRHIEVTMEGSLITAKVDGETVISASDNSFSSGGVGLRVWNNPSAQFKNFSVSR